MTHFLWVEDFNASETNRGENIVSSTVNSVFGSILDHKELSNRLTEEDSYDAQDFLSEKGILLKLNLLEALEFIHNPEELSKVDFVVLDVDMPLSREGQNDTKGYLPELIKQYQSEDNLSKIAGYQLYTELVIELGFPKSHILFCSNHARYFKDLKNKFSSANIKPPVSSNSDKPFLTKGDKVDIKQWLDHAQQDYFMLRRGIIEGCHFLKAHIEKDETNIQFRDFIKFDNEYQQPAIEVVTADIINYLDTLAQFLSLRQEQYINVKYRLFLRTLVHEWEENIDPNQIKYKFKKKFEYSHLSEYSDQDIHNIYTFAWLSKMTRNWTSHANLLEPLNPQILAFLFLVNMRAMFKLPKEVQSYEQILFSCLPEVASFNVSPEDIKLLEKDINEIMFGLKISEDKEDQNFGVKINLIYRQNTGNPDAEQHDFKNFLLQYFWVNQKEYLHTLTSRSDDFLPVLAHHIYNHSFPEA